MAAVETARQRHSPPVGTVTFLFTDIEGSTGRVLALGAERWAQLLERHRVLIREALAAEDGFEVQTEGDSFFAVFARASSAVAAAAAAQKALSREPWPPDAVVKVRMGLHTGEGQLDSDGAYVGADVHRAARIGSAAHGGQVLLSESTRTLAANTLPPGVSLLDIGEHRLKDLRPERLFQLRIDGIPCEFPPLRSLDAHPNNLPTQLTSFVGRDRELATAAGLLGCTRLLTLSGPGGTGKTRLSLQLAATAADRFPDGVWFVPLEPIRDPALVPATIAKVLGLTVAAGRSAVETIADFIGSRSVLLVLDNFEQVVAVAPCVAELLRACPNLTIIVTSRAVLHISGEQEYQVPGLPAPPDTSRLSHIELENLPPALRNPAPEQLSQYEAVKLFIARATAVRADFAVTNANAPAVAQICARLHGMPLAIELAAARIKLLSPAQILVRLERQLALLTSGSRDLPERQQTLRGAIAWSYDLLDERLRTLFSRFAVFVGGVDLEAIEAVCGWGGLDVIEGLAALVDQSLVRQSERDGETRFEMFPTIREFAMERLTEAGDAATTSAKHAAYYLALAETAAPQLGGAQQRSWLDRLEREHDNLRAAIDWASDRPDPETAVRIGFALWRFWQQRGYLNEARKRLETMEQRGWPLADPLRAKLLDALGGVAYWQADRPAARRWYDAQVDVWRRLGDKRELAYALYNSAYADLLGIMDGTNIDAEIISGGRRKCEEALALAIEVGDRLGEGNLRWALGCFGYFSLDGAIADREFRQSLRIFRETGHRTMEGWALHMLSLTVLREGQVQESWELASQALRQFHAAGDLSGVAMSLSDLSAVAVARGDRARAGRIHGASQRLIASSGTQLALAVNERFEARTRPTAVSSLTPDELERYSQEGAAMALDEAVAYALEVPAEPQPRPEPVAAASPP